LRTRKRRIEERTRPHAAPAASLLCTCLRRP
jgi:hypothetical protein